MPLFYVRYRGSGKMQALAIDKSAVCANDFRGTRVHAGASSGGFLSKGPVTDAPLQLTVVNNYAS